MEKIENRKIFLSKIIKLRNIFLSIFGVFLFITATTGIQTIDRFVPVWLYTALGISAAILLILCAISFVLKRKIQDNKL